tara:strand:- start:4687 stop:5904 length:1218 start_codon:yes stop_codon:yes gene_type:complete
MSNESNLLSALLKNRAAHDQVADKLAGVLSEQGSLVLKHAGDYYDRDVNAQSVAQDVLTNDIARSLSNPKHKELFSSLVEGLYNSEVSPANVLHDFMAVRREAAAASLASALVSGDDPTKALELIDVYSDLCAPSASEEDSGVLQAYDVGTLVKDNFDSSNLIKVYPKTLNDRLDGGVLRGHHIVVFARPEMGKTLMVVNMVYGFLRQNLRVLYVGNEEPVVDTALRIVCRLTELTKQEVHKDPAAAHAKAIEAGYGNVVLAGLAPGSPREIQKLITEYAPDVLVIDQLRNMNVGGGKDTGFTQQLEKAATAARRLGKSNDCLVISVTQAGDSASGKAVLEMGDCDSSNTGIPAQADVMIGVGASAEDETQGRRVISLCKNKRSGNHDFFAVGIDPQISRVRSLG